MVDQHLVTAKLAELADRIERVRTRDAALDDLVQDVVPTTGRRWGTHRNVDTRGQPYPAQRRVSPARGIVSPARG